MNPYSENTFLEFFVTFFTRLFSLKLFQGPLATDEIQVFVLLGVSLSCSLMGTMLVLKKQTMLANALSHTILIGIVIAFVCGASFGNQGHTTNSLSLDVLLFASFLTSLITALLTQTLTQVAGLKEDASVGIVFTGLFSLGVLLLTLFTRNVHLGTEIVMGNVDALHPNDLYLAYAVLGLNALLFLLFFKEYHALAFDPGYALSLGIAAVFFHYLLLTQVSITIVAAFRSVGVIMVLAYLVAPPLTARMVTHTFKSMLFVSCGIGAFVSLVGVALSRHVLTQASTPLSTGGITVVILALLFFLMAFREKATR